MKKIFFIIISICFIRCTKKDSPIPLNNVSKDTLVNTADNFKSHYLQEFKIISPDTIIGHDGYYFTYTYNGFKTINSKQINGEGKIIEYDTKRILNYFSNSPYDYFSLYLSNDNGETYNNFFGFYNKPIVGPTFYDMDYGMFLNTDLSHNIINIYKLVNGDSSKISSIPIASSSHYPDQIVFIDTTTVLLFSATDKYVMKSTDGGKNWGVANAINSNSSSNIFSQTLYSYPKIIPLTKDILFTYKSDYNQYQINSYTYIDVMGELTVSNDLGINWEDVNFTSSDKIIDIKTLKSGEIFLLVKDVSDSHYNNFSDLYRSSDYGKTWIKVNEKQFYAKKIDFKDPNLGIAIDDGIVQITKDGGKTWKLITH